ncbi:MAG TPA: tyrosine-type recombinase/integrase [Kribbellaceae bacterium]|nr:tyrosine-type recombinase/integrase [Kribbellaceae bacterium]
MSTSRVVFKRCGCVDPATGRRRNRRCPRLSRSGHGSWYFRCSTRDVFGRAQRVRRGGYGTRVAALLARQEFLAYSVEERTAASWTVARWLRYWLTTRTGIRPTTRLSHTGYVERFLVPHLGSVPLGQLTTRHVAEMFVRIGRDTNRSGRPHTPCTLAHIRTTLRAALNAAVRHGLIVDNPARRVELPTHARPRPVVWSRSRVAAWRATGARPPIAVWTPRQLARFLRAVRGDRLYALWWLLALRGLRRGEAAALRWTDLDLDHAELTVARARTSAGYQVHEGSPKTAAGQRTIALDRHTVKVLRAHRRRQRAERVYTGGGGQPGRDSGYVFTTAEGAPLHPQYLTRRFAKLVFATGLPPVRLHDLRHGAACLAHAAGADLKTLQHQLGHASIAITADTYTTVLPAAQRHSARATAELLLRANRTRARQKARKTKRTDP